MQKKILSYIISFTLGLVSFTTVQAQDKKNIEPEKKVKEPLYNGMMVHADIASMAATALGNGEKFSYEGGVQFDLRHKYFPVVELGYAGADKTTAEKAVFKTAAPFGRIGLDFNLLKKGKDAKPSNNLFLAGVRMGMCSYKYDITNLSTPDNYWDKGGVINYPGISDTRLWWEFVAGVRVEVIRNIYMGWNVRTKGLFRQDKEGEVAPWYIPGFGLNTAGSWGLNYTLGYHF